MTQTDLDAKLAILAQKLVDDRVSPAASLAVATRGPEGFRFAVGAAGIRSLVRPSRVTPSTPFDLASVTKPFVACTCARLVRMGLLGWNEPLGEILPEARGTASARVPLILFLSHRAGLDAHLPLFAARLEGKPVDVRAALRVAANARFAGRSGPPPPEGFPPLYSDLGYLLAGAAVARAAATELARAVEREVTVPLGLHVMSSTTFRHFDLTFDERVAPTETQAFRGGEIVGVVHDENAWALAEGGIAGHAGLFGTAEGVARFGAAVLDALAGRDLNWLEPKHVEPLVRPRPGGTLRAGFDGRSDVGSSAGARFGPRAFGHLGFTGTSLWCDPDADIVAVILTNRVCPTREHVAIREARPLINDQLFSIAEALKAADPR